VLNAEFNIDLGHCIAVIDDQLILADTSGVPHASERPKDKPHLPSTREGRPCDVELPDYAVHRKFKSDPQRTIA
jgi:hypothetical protein